VSLSSQSSPQYSPKVWKALTQWIHSKKDYKPQYLSEPEPRSAINETYRILNTPLHNISVKQEIPPELTAALENNVFFFSGFKTHHQLVEASKLLKDENGNFKPFNKFLKDVATIDSAYNRNYLNAEYNFATASSQMAVQWKEWEKSSPPSGEPEGAFDLQYRTAGDDRVREEHAALNGTTLPQSDPFWKSYLPPNDWNCRCTTVQVHKGKYPQSDSDKAIAKANAMTDTPKKQIFRFNPGAQQKIFPPKHPYYKAPEQVNDTVTKIAKQTIETWETVETQKGTVKVSSLHNKLEKAGNIEIATTLANKYEHDINLIATQHDNKTADSFNKTLDIYQEYKTNKKSTFSAIDRELRDAKNQADHVVINVKSKISEGDITNAVKSRVKRAGNIKSVWIIKNNFDKQYLRKEILSDNFKIQWD